MVRIIASVSLAACLLLTITWVNAAPVSKPQVMILGVAHLAARRDIHNAVFQDSPLTPKRQVQITEVVERLTQFHPTKVLVEAPMGDQKILQQYRRYLVGDFSLPADEVYQFGFKVAAHARNSTIYPIDTWGPTLIDDNSASGKLINSYLKDHFTDVRDPRFNAFLAREDALERNGTYLDLLRYLNTDAAIRANASWYSIFDGMGREADFAGSAYTAQWYVRNAYIFSNILSVIRPGDRVIVMMGQGHEYLLREFTRLNPNVTYVDPLRYLK